MKNLPYFWQDNLVADKMIAGKLTFLRGVYKDNRLIGAKMYEQSLAASPDEKDGEPEYVSHLDLHQAPVLFSMSGGQRWLYQKNTSYEGLQLECEFGNRGHLKNVKQVRFDVKYLYTDKIQAYHNLRETGKTFAFKSCKRLEIEHFFNQKRKEFRPVFMLPENEHGFNHFEGLYPRSAADEKLRLLGCYTYEKGRFCNFVLAECLPEELANYFSR
ncbi:MAG TPA: hypothetical protein DD619_02530 [Alphaproteobacteria bacterium]|nr:hypothetical protein [Alphaproteobacteria bacterium]